MVALINDLYGLPSVAYIKGYLAEEEGIAKHCNPYRQKTRQYDSWTMGYEDSQGIHEHDNQANSDTQECV